MVTSVAYDSCFPALRERGYYLVPGIRTYGANLTRQSQPEAWELLLDVSLRCLIEASPIASKETWTFDDFGQPRRLYGCRVATKQSKSHVTFVGDAAERLAGLKTLPETLRQYFDRAAKLMTAVQQTFDDIAGQPPLKCLMNLRVFEYNQSDSLAMRSHVDGSRLTLVVAESDRCLEILGNDDKWLPVCRGDGRPFAIVIPGQCLWDQRIRPTCHRVAPVSVCRYSTTLFQMADLGDTSERAEEAIKEWIPYMSVGYQQSSAL